MPFTKILCAVDGSPPSVAARDVGVRLASELGARVSLAQVMEPIYWAPEAAYGMMQVYEAARRAIDESLAKEATEAGASAPGVPIEIKRLDGVAWDALARFARTDGFDLVVLGTRGRTGIRHLLGSVAERVVRHAPCSVLVVPGRTVGPPRFRSILCPVDFSDESRAAMLRATELAKRFGARLTLFHVYTRPPSYLTLPVAMMSPRQLDADVAECKRLLTAWRLEAEQLGAKDAHVLWALGTPWQEIVREAERGQDLVVMGTHGRTGLQHALLGSVAERVARHAPCAVLAVRRPA